MGDLHASVADALSRADVARSERLLVAVSGGADSVALLHLLVAIGQTVAVGHVHHGLRPDADGDADFVAALAARLGVPSTQRRVEASRTDGRSPEARARALRYRALEEIRRAHGCVSTATAHTLDDQAETVLLRQLRGTGLDGLAAIEPLCRERRLVRPVLGLRRVGLRSYLRSRGSAWREDQSNQDLTLQRNRLRAEVLPVLEEMQPGAAERLAVLAELAREARDAQRPALEELLARVCVDEGEDALDIDAAPLRGLAPARRSAALRALLARAGLGTRVTRGHVERISAFLEQAPRGAALSLPGDRALIRTERGFRLAAAAPRRSGNLCRPPMR